MSISAIINLNAIFLQFDKFGKQQPKPIEEDLKVVLGRHTGMRIGTGLRYVIPDFVKERI